MFFMNIFFQKQKEKMIASQTMLDLVMKMVIVAMLQVELNAPILFADPQKVSFLFFEYRKS